MIVTALITRGLAPWAAKLLAYVGLPLLLLIAALLALDAWGDSRFRAGKADEKAIWQAASDKLIKEATVSAEAADRKEVPRLVEQAAKVEQERNRIDAALENGTSTIDALFPAAGGNGL
jgi:hypothetical protein